MAYFERRSYAPGMLTVRRAPGLYRAYAKRIFDLVAVAIMAIPVLMVVAVTAIVVAMDGKSPFYLQKRVGRGGREFSIIKLRSMVENADEFLAEYLRQNPDARAEWDEKQKLQHDPRITRVGRFIRKTSLDELPQIWNVVAGDMSLVGPRPMMPSQKEIYPGRAYYDMRPGITGLWQVSQRNEASFKQRAFYDNLYHRELSLGADLFVMFKTVFVVLRANGH